MHESCRARAGRAAAGSEGDCKRCGHGYETLKVIPAYWSESQEQKFNNFLKEHTVRLQAAMRSECPEAALDTVAERMMMGFEHCEQKCTANGIFFQGARSVDKHQFFSPWRAAHLATSRMCVGPGQLGGG